MKRVAESKIKRWWLVNEYDCNSNRFIAQIIQSEFESLKELEDADDKTISSVFNEVRGQYMIWQCLPEESFYEKEILISREEVSKWRGWPKPDVASLHSDSLTRGSVVDYQIKDYDLLIIESEQNEPAKRRERFVVEGNHRLSSWWLSNKEPCSVKVYFCPMTTVPRFFTDLEFYSVLHSKQV